jgi:hypothetical protein
MVKLYYDNLTISLAIGFICKTRKDHHKKESKVRYVFNKALPWLGIKTCDPKLPY